ncbi:MAG: undecaprenyldiphospho-muramoylpentapeptide beta-N-acetylglucosaminyltransferase [Chromatiales bacterium]
MSRPILIMAGGTGGHVYPALAVALHLRELGVPLLWLGSRHGLETRIVPEVGIPLLTIAISGLRGHGLPTLLAAPFKLLLAIAQALLLLGRNRPAAALGMGGFASGPGGLAAWMLRVPLLLHEQNAVLGLTNRLLAPLAVRLMEAFPGTFARKAAARTGNPVRAEILTVPAQRPAHRTRTHLLVLGGSQGARALNQVLPQALQQLGDLRLEVWHQSGAEKLQDATARYLEAGLQVRIDPYIERMDEAYAWADLVVCRAGAMTVAELSAAGVASVLVPYPHAADDHQTANARYLSEPGAAVLIPESELTPGRLATVIRRLIEDGGQMLRMAEAARAQARADATEKVAQACIEVAYA